MDALDKESLYLTSLGRDEERGYSERSPDMATARTDLRETTRSLKAVRTGRMQLQKDAHLLQNRLRILKLEETRARKRIQLARQRAIRILQIRREQDEEIEMRLNAKSDENQRRKKLRQKLQTNREMIKAQIMRNREKEVEDKLKSVRLHKLERSKNQQDIRRQRKHGLAKAIKNTKLIKQQRDIRRMKLQDAKAGALYKSKLEYDYRLSEEHQMKNQEEQLLQDLEREERKLMERLQEQTMR